MKTAIPLTLLVLAGFLIATPLVITYWAAIHGTPLNLGPDLPKNCQLSGIAMGVFGVLFSFAALFRSNHP